MASVIVSWANVLYPEAVYLVVNYAEVLFPDVGIFVGVRAESAAATETQTASKVLAAAAAERWDQLTEAGWRARVGEGTISETAGAQANAGATFRTLGEISETAVPIAIEASQGVPAEMIESTEAGEEPDATWDGAADASESALADEISSAEGGVEEGTGAGTEAAYALDDVGSVWLGTADHVATAAASVVTDAAQIMAAFMLELASAADAPRIPATHSAEMSEGMQPEDAFVVVDVSVGLWTRVGRGTDVWTRI